MSPTYTAPAIETIHQGEKLFTRDGHRELFNTLGLEGPRERARPSSSRSHTYGKKHRSGSPQVHPSLKASPVAVTADDARRASCTPVPRTRLRRNASVDFSILRETITGLDEWYRDGSDGDRAQQARELKKARLLPSPRRPTPLRSLSDHGADPEPDRSRSSVVKGKQVTRDEARNEALEGAASEHEASTNSSEETLRCLEGVPHSGREEYLNATGGERRSSWAGHDRRTFSPSPSSSSPSSSRTSTPSSIASSLTTVDTDISINSQDVDGQETPIGPTPSNAHTTSNNRRSADPDRYGTPEMPRGSAKLPHIPNNGLTPRVPSQNHPKHLPRAEKLPKSGYELLASTISSSSVSSATRNRLSTFLETAPAGRRGNPSQRRHSSASASFFNQQNMMAPPPDEDLTIKPIYRRFEALNHRLLLHLQDELSELEEQLHRLDTTDTQTRRLQSSILPASRRAEFLVGGELQSHKTEILSKIAFKLGQYNHALSSFTSTRDLPAPALSAVTEYRDYLATYRPISDVETRFLDSTEDLVTLEAPSASSPSSTTSIRPDDSDARRAPAGDYLQSLHLPSSSSNNDDEQPIVTPIPGTMHGNSWLVRHNRLSGSRGSSATSSSPRFARPFPGALEPLASPRLPPSPLRQQHRPASLTVPEEKRVSAQSVPPFSSGNVMVHLALALAMAVAMPVLAFSIIPGFVARMIVVLLVGLSVAGSVAQAVDLKRLAESRGDLVYSGAIYAGVMAIVAGVVR